MVLWLYTEHDRLSVVLQKCMTKSRKKIALIVRIFIMAIFCDDIVVIDEPLEEDDGFRIIEWTFDIIGFHMALVERSSEDFSKLWWCEEMEYLARWIHGVVWIIFLKHYLLWFAQHPFPSCRYFSRIILLVHEFSGVFLGIQASSNRERGGHRLSHRA